MNITESRDKLMALQREVEALPQVDCPLEHFFAPGQYLRKIFMPKGSVIIGKVHLHRHLNVIIKGRCTVVTPDGKKNLKAGDIFVSEAGTKRAVYNHTDVVWATIHTREDESTDLKVLETRTIAPSFGHFDVEEQKRRIPDFSAKNRVEVSYD